MISKCGFHSDRTIEKVLDNLHEYKQFTVERILYSNNDTKCSDDMVKIMKLTVIMMMLMMMMSMIMIVVILFHRPKYARISILGDAAFIEHQGF